MPITAISRDWGVSPSIVRIVTTDNLAAITANGYLTTQIPYIAAIQHGSFQWDPTDLVSINYAGGDGFFNVDYTVNFTFIPLVENTQSGGFYWNDVTTGAANAVKSNAYYADSAALTTFTLPAAPDLGETYRFINANTGGFSIVYNAGQYIRLGDENTTVSVGSLNSMTEGDEVTVSYFKNGEFFAYASQGNVEGV